MPVEAQKVDATQDSPVKGMTTATQKPNGDMPQVAPTFSYAQAAKGRPPAVPSLPTSKVPSEAADIEGRTRPSSEMGQTSDIPKNTSTDQSAKEKHPSQKDGTKATDAEEQAQVDNIESSNKSGMETVETAVAGQSQPDRSDPPTPEYGTTSTSTLIKEDDTFSTVNGSSDATSDKQSQTSANGQKSVERQDPDKEQNTAATWAEEATITPPALKEAPPPPVNVWKMRSDALKKQVPGPIQPSKPASLTNGITNTPSASKSKDISSEPKRQESKKKPKVGQGEERVGLGGRKENGRSLEGADKKVIGTMASPPPPGDAVSWPTPDNIVSDTKKTSQDRQEKGDKESPLTPKPHGKEKWVAVPFVPSAVFNTPLPQSRRGGRGGPRGGREGEYRGRNTGVNGGGEKPATAGATNATSPVASGQERGKTGSISASNSNNSKPKRASSAGPAAQREQRKFSEPSIPERRKEEEAGSPKVNQPISNTTRRPSAPTTSKDSQSARPSAEGGDLSWRNNAVPNDAQLNRKPTAEFPESKDHPRPNGPERRSDSFVKTFDSAREFQINGGPRERGEPRPERGRGGYRGRGTAGHAFHNPNLPNGHGYSNGYPSQHQYQSASPSKPQSNHDRLPLQSQGPYQAPHHQPRHYRSNSRSQSIPHSNPYGRFSNGHHGGPPHLANLQTDLANEYGYIPAHQGAMTAIPFNSYTEQPSVFGMVNLQMNYYFSIENLCKDVYLRSHMDSQGFVFLDLLAQFNRIKQLTNDMDLIRQACLHSQTIEYVNVDGIDRVRARQGWDQWVLRIEDRDASARNDGPALQQPPQHGQPYGYGHGHPYEDRFTVFPRSNGPGNSMENSPHQPLNGAAPSFGHQMSGEPSAADTAMMQTPLSAAASEFSFSSRSQNQRNVSTPDSHGVGTSVFTDDQVESLHILIRRPPNAVASMPPPFHTSSSRTFSNGSIDGRSINEELSRFADRHSRPLVNGEVPESSGSPVTQRSRSPFSAGSPTWQTGNSVSPPVLWSKDHQISVEAHSNIPKDCVHQSYHNFRQDALKEREQPVPGKHNPNMQSLYEFWAHFLVRNFNIAMYEEFHRLALEDAMERNSQTGMRNLLRFYDESLLGHKEVSGDNVAQDFLELVKAESTKPERPIFTKLRAVWRNGAFNMRNRSKLIKLLDATNAELKAELDR